MKKQELNEVLAKHKLWLEGKEGGERAVLIGSDLSNSKLRNSDLRNSDLSNSDLSNSDLRNSDLRNSDLRGSDLNYSDLRGSDLNYSDLSNSDLSNSDLRGSNIDFSCLPLWCGSLKAIWDKRHIIQFLYHAVAPCFYHPEIIEDDEDLKELMQNPLLIKVCNKFHRNDCPRINEIKPEEA